MNETEMNTPASVDVSQQLGALQRQVFTLLLVLIVVSGTLTVFLYRQASLTRKDIAIIKPQAVQVIQAFNQNRAAMQNLLNQFITYGAKNPDFAQQVLKKNGIAASPAPKK